MPAYSKSQGGITYQSVYSEHYNPGLIDHTLVSTTSMTGCSQKVTQGVPLVGYHRRRARGELLPFTYFFQWERNTSFCDTQPSTLKVSSLPNWSEVWTPDMLVSDTWLTRDGLAILDSWDKSQTAPYIQRAAANIQESGFDLGTWLAELSSTRRMFESNVVKFRKWLNRTEKERLWRNRRSKSEKIMDWTQESVNRWLEARYGLRPLISDWNNLNEAMAMLGQGYRRVMKCSGASYETPTTLSRQPAGEDAARKEFYDDYWNVKVELRGCVTADMKLSPFWINPVTTAWEMVKFSFVVDWFFSVGDALSAASFVVMNPSYVAKSGCRITEDRDFYLWAESKSPYYFTTAPWRRVTSKTVVNYREPASVSLTPHFLPRFDSWKAVDLLSLLTQAIYRR